MSRHALLFLLLFYSHYHEPYVFFGILLCDVGVGFIIFGKT